MFVSCLVPNLLCYHKKTDVVRKLELWVLCWGKQCPPNSWASMIPRTNNGNVVTSARVFGAKMLILLPLKLNLMQKVNLLCCTQVFQPKSSWFTALHLNTIRHYLVSVNNTQVCVHLFPSVDAVNLPCWTVIWKNLLIAQPFLSYRLSADKDGLWTDTSLVCEKWNIKVFEKWSSSLWAGAIKMTCGDVLLAMWSVSPNESKIKSNDFSLFLHKNKREKTEFWVSGSNCVFFYVLGHT